VPSGVAHGEAARATTPAGDVWALPQEGVFDSLHTSPRGLVEDEAFRRLRSYGRNVLPAKVGRPIYFRFLYQFTTLFAIMLEVAAVLVFIAAMLSTGASRQDNINVTIAILGVVLLNATIGFLQEYRAEKPPRRCRSWCRPTPRWCARARSPSCRRPSSSPAT